MMGKLGLSIVTTSIGQVMLLFVLVVLCNPAIAAQPTKNNGQQCGSPDECYSGACYPGPGDGRASFCMSTTKNCAWPNTDGYMSGARSCWQGQPVGCMIPDPSNPQSRWRFAPTGQGTCIGTTKPAQ